MGRSDPSRKKRSENFWLVGTLRSETGQVEIQKDAFKTLETQLLARIDELSEIKIATDSELNKIISEKISQDELNEGFRLEFQEAFAEKDHKIKKVEEFRA